MVHSHVAIYIQIGSFVNFLLILHSLRLFGLKNKSEVIALLMMRYVQLLIVFLYIVAISLSNTLHTFKMSLYLSLSCSYYGSIYIFVIYLIDIFGSDRSSRNANVRPFVRLCQTIRIY